MSGTKKHSVLKSLLVILLLTAGFTLAGVGLLWGASGYKERTASPLIFSEKKMLYELWEAYKADKLEKGTGRTLDTGTRENITTSEGQSYTMLRAVWMDDKPVFDRSLQWAKDNLQRDDYLFSWKFGQRPDGTYGIMTESGGQNAASDAEVDIALALLMAYERWGDERYLGNAQQIIQAMWENEVVMVGGKPVLAANNLERPPFGGPDVAVNPSYFAPYAFRIFAHVDKQHPWNAVVDSSYAILEAAMSSPIDKPASIGLPPNWLMLDRKTGAILATYPTGYDSNYGYDAIRVPWRLAMDSLWFQEPRSKKLLSQLVALQKDWRATGELAAVYAHNGPAVAKEETYATYATFLAYLSVTEPDEAAKVYKRVLTPLYDPDLQSWRSPMSYYDDNWVWFGMALHARQLPNLALESGESGKEPNPHGN